MNIEFEAQLLKQLGFTIEPDNLADSTVEDDHGWAMSHANWPVAKRCGSRSEVALWLYSRGLNVYSQYLAILHFREMLNVADDEAIASLRAWGEGNRVKGGAKVLVEEVLRLSRQEVVLDHDTWRSNAFEILFPHMQARYLPLGVQMGLEFDAFMRLRVLDGGRPRRLIFCLWRRFRDGVQRLGDRIHGAKRGR